MKKPSLIEPRPAKRLGPLKSIRAKCLDCCCGSSPEVQKCVCDGEQGSWCPLYPYRSGHNPRRKGIGPRNSTFLRQDANSACDLAKNIRAEGKDTYLQTVQQDS